MSYLRDNPNTIYMVADTETESLNLLCNNKPWGVSYILYQNGKILEEYNKYVWWNDLNISEGAARITRFDYQKYKEKAEDAAVILKDVQKYLLDPSIVKVFHNGSNFDCYIIKNWCEALSQKNNYSYLNDTIDTNALARAIKKGIKKIERKDWKMMMFRFANYVEKGLKTNLTALGKEFKIEYDYENSLHDALQDVRLTALVFDQLKFRIEI